MFEEDRITMKPGDIIITAVAHTFNIGRVMPDGVNQEPLCHDSSVESAISAALTIAGETGVGPKVYMYWNPGSNQVRLIPARTVEAVPPRKPEKPKQQTAIRTQGQSVGSQR